MTIFLVQIRQSEADERAIEREGSGFPQKFAKVFA
jgi:hypothetical protein